MEVDGTETWLCRFSGAKMRELQRFVRALDAVIQGKPLPADERQEEDGDDMEYYLTVRQRDSQLSIRMVDLHLPTEEK